MRQCCPAAASSRSADARSAAIGFSTSRSIPWASRSTPISAWSIVGTASVAASIRPNNSRWSATAYAPKGAATDWARARLMSATATSSADGNSCRTRAWWRPNAPAPITATRILDLSCRQPRKLCAKRRRWEDHRPSGWKSYNSDLRLSGLPQELFAIEQKRAARVHRQGCGVGFPHGGNRARADDRNIESHILIGFGNFHHSQAPAVRVSSGAPYDGVSTLHSLYRHAGAIANNHTLANIEGSQGAGDATAVVDIRHLLLVGGSWGDGAFRGQQGLQEGRGVHDLNAFFGENAGDGPQ